MFLNTLVIHAQAMTDLKKKHHRLLKSIKNLPKTGKFNQIEMRSTVPEAKQTQITRKRLFIKSHSLQLLFSISFKIKEPSVIKF